MTVLYDNFILTLLELYMPPQVLGAELRAHGNMRIKLNS